jgi:hypothetical protein
MSRERMKEFCVGGKKKGALTGPKGSFRDWMFGVGSVEIF